MRPNSTSSQITGATRASPAAASTTSRASPRSSARHSSSRWSSACDTPLFAVVLFAAVGALAYAEQRYNGAVSQHSVSTARIARRVHA